MTEPKLPTGDRKTDDEILIEALQILSSKLVTEDGVISACLANAAARLETLVEERRWVSVGERLPEEGVEVLWWCGEPGQDMGVYVGAKKGLLIEWGSHEWVIDSECFTHWKPLPPGPETKATE